MTEETREAVRLALRADHPAERMICLETHVPTGDGFSDAFDLAEDALGPIVPQGGLVAYLLRRFGHPNKGSDPDKDLASWLLTTTHPEMLLRATPYAGGDTAITFSFHVPRPVLKACSDWIVRERDAHAQAFLDWIEAEGRVPEWADEVAEGMSSGGWPVPEGATGWRRMMPGIAMISHLGAKDGDPEEKAAAIRWHREAKADFESLRPTPPVRWRGRVVAEWDDADPMKPFAEAMGETLRDLLRPVWIRDSAIGIHGPIEDDDADGRGPAAPEAVSAGYPLGAMGNHDPAGFAALAAAVTALDPDLSTAMARAAAILRDAAVPPERRPEAEASGTDGAER